MTTKKSQIISEVQEDAEQAPEASQRLTATEKYQNALAEIARLKQEKESKQSFITDKSFQIALAQQNFKEARAACNQAVQSEQESLGRIERQQAMAKIGGEAEQAVLQTLLKEHELLTRDAEFAKSNLDEAILLRDQIPALAEGLDQINEHLDQLTSEQRQMESICDELWQSVGRERAETIKANIEAAKKALIEDRDATADLKRRYNEAVGCIEDLRRNWPALYDQILMSHSPKAADRDQTPGEKILQSYRQYVCDLLTYGPRAHQRVFGDKARFVDFLGLDTATVAELMKGALQNRKAYDVWGREIEVPAHEKLNQIDALTEDQIHYRGYN